MISDGTDSSLFKTILKIIYLFLLVYQSLLLLLYRTLMETASLRISDFYMFCRNNDIDSVKSLLETITSEQIDQLEPNGSTALHVASYYGHDEIVKLLLEKGASRSITNKYNLTPYEEGKTDATRQLFSRNNADGRFLGDANNTIEWIRVGEHIDLEAKAIRKMLKAYSVVDKKEKKEIQIEMIDLGNYEGIDKIKRYFDQVNENNDPVYMLKAYTEETEFYRRLNRALATAHELNQADKSQRQLLDFLNLIFYHPRFHNYQYRGVTYRGMKMTDVDLKQYEIGAKFMTKTLLSTSKDRNIAERFAAKKQTDANGNEIKQACIFKYQIRKAYRALAIEELSVFPHEQEVLVIPYSAFEVVNIQEMTTDNGIITEIELRQCKSYIKIQTAAAIGQGLVGVLELAGTILGAFTQ